MSDKYLRRLSVLLFSLFSLSLSAQVYNKAELKKLTDLKKEGKLTGTESITNPNPHSVYRVSGPPVVSPIRPLSNCANITQDTSFHVVPFDGSGGSGGPGLPPDYRNDDWSSAAITLPFNFCFYGQQMNQIFINNNGNVSFGTATPVFSASSFPIAGTSMIAAFWADVDTRGPNSGVVYYSLSTTHIIIHWDHVGYFNMMDSMLNPFWLTITDGVDPILPLGKNVGFTYEDMQWTTGSASGGVGGFGGTPATVGVNQGNGVDYVQFGLFDQTGSSYDGAYGLNDGVDWLDFRTFTMDVCVSNANIPPVLNSLNICDTIHLCENSLTLLTANYLSPELGQTTTITFDAHGMTGVNVVANMPGNTATLGLEITGNASNLGYHTITITATDDGTPAGVTVSDVVIEIVPAPLPSFTFSPASPVLANTTVTFTNTSPPGLLLTWNFGDGSPTTTLPNPQHVYTTPGIYNVTLTAVYPVSGCTTTITQQIVVTGCTAATFTINNVCANDPTTITFTSMANPGSVFTWDFDGGTVLSGSGSGPYDVSWGVSGNHNVSLTVTDSMCNSSVTMPVSVFATPVASITPILPLCEGDSPVVDFDGTAGAGATYTWGFGSASVLSGSGSGPYNLQWNAAGNDQVTLVVSENGCTDSTQIPVQVNAIPTADFNVAAVACAGDSINVNYIGSANAGAVYEWDFNGGNVVSGNSQGPYTITFTAGGNYNISLNVTENNCLSPTVFMPVVVTDLPVVAISPVAALCQGASATVSFTGIAGLAALYNWNFGNATVVSGGGVGPYSLEWQTAGTDLIQLSVDENGCSASLSINVTVNPIPTSDFVVNNAACVNQPINLSYNGTAGAGGTYAWVFTSGNVLSGNGQGPYSVVWNSPGTYQVSLIVTENGCVSPVTNLQASVNPLPAVFAGLDQQVCSGTPVPLGVSPFPGEVYAWSPTTNLSDPTMSDPVATPVNQTIADVQDDYILTVTDANGCVNTDSVSVTSFPEPVISFVTPQSQCIENNSFLLSGLSNIPSGVNYSWTFTPQANLSSSTQTSLSVSYSAIGTYPVLLTGDYNGCPAQPFVDSVTIYEMPVADFVPQVFNGCSPLTVPFNNMSGGNGNSYSWNFGDGSNDNSENPVHVFQNANLYTVSLTTTSLHGCATDTTFVDLIDAYPVPVGNFIANPQTANVLAPIVQFQNYSVNADVYAWDFGDNDTSTTWNPNHLYPAVTGTYIVTLMLMTNQGCVDTVRSTVIVEDNFSFYIPSAFTPDGDGVNDYFGGYGVAITNYNMNIYNRWGELIFTTNTLEKPWDGKMKSGVVQNDVYVYRFQLVDHHGEQHTYVGNVAIVR